MLVELMFVASLLAVVPSAEARPRRSYRYSQTIRRSRVARRAIRVRRARVTHTQSVQVISHPAGCPRRAFCGCGASVHLFGRPIRDLFLAANWFKFPRAAPAPGTVAVRRGHVFVISQVLGGNKVLAHDYNSGRGQSRVHVRSLAGFTVVRPRG